MQKTFFKLPLLLACLFLALGMKAQTTYSRYWNESMDWWEALHSEIIGFNPPCWGSPGQSSSTSHFFVDGQVFLDGYWWYAIKQESQSDVYCAGGPINVYPPYLSNYPVLYIREDSTGKIWKKESLNSAGILLADFGQNPGIGDTIWYNNFISYCDIVGIDSIQVGTDVRRVYTCGCSESFFKISALEGFGSMRGIRDYFFCPRIGDFYSEMLCISKDGFGISFNPHDTCGFQLHGLVGAEEPSPTEPPTLYWDNANSSLVFGSSLIGYDWRLYDLTGKLLYEGKSSNSELSLDLQQAGIYLLMLEKAGQPSRSLRFLKY